MPRVGNTKKVLLALCVLLIGTAVLVRFVRLARAPSYSGDAGKVEIEWILPPNYYQGTDFSEGRAWVQKEENGPWMLIDEDGNILKDGLEADVIANYRYGIANFMYQSLSLTGFLNLSGDVVATGFSGTAVECAEGLINKQGENGLWGFIDMEGNWAVSPDYDSVGWFWEGMASVQKDNKYCYIDKNGELAIDLNFDMAWHFSNDVAAVSINSMIGLIDKRGGWIVEPIYEDIAVPWSDLIGMQKNGKIGFIDTAGNVVIDFKFPRDPKRSLIYAYCFNNDRAAVIFDEDRPEYGIIDRSGNIVFTVVGGGIPYFEGDYVVTRDDNGRFVLIDINGGRHYLPPYFKYPPIGVNSTKDNIFRTWDTAGKDAKTGYFKIK